VNGAVKKGIKKDLANYIFTKIEMLQKEFIWGGKTTKIKHSTLISDYEKGGLKDIDVKTKTKHFNSVGSGGCIAKFIIRGNIFL